MNVLAYRLIKNQSIVTPRSSCPYCKSLIAWYDNIPVFSWILLNGKCRECKKNISWLYPFIELLTTLLLILLYNYIPHQYFFGYFVFFSALIVTIRSDIETMLISRFTTIFLVPISCMFSATKLLPITLTECITGAFFGYFFLFTINTVFAYLRNKQGIGEGDFDLLVYIGSCTGIIGCWISITLGSLLGSFYGIYILINTCNNTFTADTKIPFGPFLAIGAILFIFLQKHFFNHLMLA